MKSESIKTTATLFGLLTAITLSPAQAHDDKDPRHIAMASLGKNMKAIKKGLKAGGITPDLLVSAKEIEEVSSRLVSLFPKGPQQPDSRARPEIWTDMPGFKKANGNFRAAAAGLVKALSGTDVATAENALKQTGKTCGGCHKPYRLPKK